jgi:hypothetical protein
VCVVDTGCGSHAWLDGLVTVGLTLGARSVGYDDPATDPEVTGDLDGPLDGSLDALAGHGTFIAGVVRQACPDADLIAVRAVLSDGLVVETFILDVLQDLLAVVARHYLGREDGRRIDVLNLSMGYYHEQGEGFVYDEHLWKIIHMLGRLGVCVVVSAGNDATTRPTYPAGFAGLSRKDPRAVPLLSVGAQNPDGTRAAFSNAGEWVSDWALGANVVSTFPTTFDAGAQAVMGAPDPDGVWRATIDPDCFAGGFGLWSGTSFAAPLVAGRIAARLLGKVTEEDDSVDGDPQVRVARAVARGREAAGGA